jgi:hypothetical protein
MGENLLRFDGFYIEVEASSETISTDSFFILQFFPDKTVGQVHIEYRIDYLQTKTDKLAYFRDLIRNYDWDKESHKEKIGGYTLYKGSAYMEIFNIPMLAYLREVDGKFFNWTGYINKDSLDLQLLDAFWRPDESHLFEFVAFDF